MKWDNTAGLMGFVGLTVCAILLGAPLYIFFDPGAFTIGFVGTFFLLLATHGWAASWSAISTGLHGLIRNCAHLGTENHEHGFQIARSGSLLSLLVGTSGALIGIITMLQNLDDPRSIGPAMATALLCVFYTLLINLCIFVPVGRYHREMAKTTPQPAGTNPRGL